MRIKRHEDEEKSKRHEKYFPFNEFKRDAFSFSVLLSFLLPFCVIKSISSYSSLCLLFRRAFD